MPSAIITQKTIICMEIKIEVPDQIKRFAEDAGISVAEIRNKITSYIEKDMLDVNCKQMKMDSIRVVVNGVHKDRGTRIIINNEAISKEKPLKTVFRAGSNYSIYYLIYKQ